MPRSIEDSFGEAIIPDRPSGPRQISLRFGADVSPAIWPRISYAFRIFAAIYDYKVVEPGNDNTILRCFYSAETPQPFQESALHIPARYKDVRFLDTWKRALVRQHYAGEEFQLAFGIDASSGKPDWLGELFLWLSGSYELDIVQRDCVGRIPSSEMVFSSGVSPHKPHASMLMAWMQSVLVHGSAKEALVPAPSPLPWTRHIVISSHDVDFYFVDRTSAMLRLIKNFGIATRTYASWSHFSDNLKMFLQLLCGKRVGDYLPALLEAGEKYDFHSTLFVVPRRGHRRDPNYSLEQISPLLSDVVKRGFPVGVHGSYRSLMEDRTLRAEAQALRRRTGTKPLAGRQHWLRFSNLQHLFAEVSRAGLLCDSTLGFSDQIGFRNGASFAFPPYDFENERPHQFLEIPLVVMDKGLHAASRSLRKNPQELADKVLAESRKYGWGGVAVLWHDPIEPLAVPSEINEVFWNSLKKKKDFQEKWMSVDQFLASCLERYQQAGLMQGVRIDG